MCHMMVQFFMSAHKLSHLTQICLSVQLHIQAVNSHLSHSTLYVKVKHGLVENNAGILGIVGIAWFSERVGQGYVQFVDLAEAC